MQWGALLLGVGFGAAASWGITHVYYRKSARDQAAVYGKLTDQVREVIRSDQREKLTVPELNELLERLTFDEKALASGDPLPFIRCPKCGNEDLKRSMRSDYEHDESYYFISCASCGWGEWTQ